MLKDNIKVGDYARNKKGIGKITDIKDHGEYVEIILDNFHDIIEYPNGKEAGTLRNKIVMRKGTIREDIKIGKLIDLIEYCDIVKYKIDDEEFISEVWGEKNNYFVQNFDVPIDLRDLNIVSIVTKECFKSMEYKIER